MQAHTPSARRPVALVRCVCLLAAGLVPALLLRPQQGQASSSWAAPVNLSLNLSMHAASSVAVAVDGAGLVHVVWEDDSGTPQLFHAYGAYGQTTNSFRVEYLADGQQPAMAADASGRVHLVWAKDVGGSQDIFYTFWNGAGWEPWPNVSNTAGQSTQPSIAVRPGEVDVVWSESSATGTLLYRATSANGVQWSSAPLFRARDGLFPTVADPSTGQPHLTWQGLDLETSWPTVLYSDLNDVSAFPEIVPDDRLTATRPSLALTPAGVPCLAWQEQAQRKRVYFGCRSGGVWVPAPVTADSMDVTDPRLAMDAAGVRHLIAAQVSPATEIDYWRGAGENGWSTPERVSSGTEVVSAPALFVEASGNVHAAWIQGSGAHDVFYSERSTGAESTPTSTSTSTPSPTWTATFAPSSTPTPTPTPSRQVATPTSSPTPTATPTPVASATSSPAPVATGTLASSATQAPTAAPSQPPLSATATPVPATPTSSPTSTRQPEPSATPTSTLAPSATPSPSPTATIPPSATVAPSATATATRTPTSSPTPAPSATATRMATPTRSVARLLYLPLVMKGEGR